MDFLKIHCGYHGKNNERRYAFGGPRTESPPRKIGSNETSSSSGRTQEIASGSQTTAGLDVRIACREANRFWQTWHDSESWGTDPDSRSGASSEGDSVVSRPKLHWQWQQQETATGSLALAARALPGSPWQQPACTQPATLLSNMVARSRQVVNGRRVDKIGGCVG